MEVKLLAVATAVGAVSRIDVDIRNYQAYLHDRGAPVGLRTGFW
jgi:hypothetical protein